MSNQVWIPIFGNARIADGVITHIPIHIPSNPSAMPSADGSSAQPPHTVVRSNMEFDQGSISWEAKLGEENSRVQLLLPVEAGAASAAETATGDASNADLSAGLNVLGAPYGFAVYKNGAWEPAGGTGQGSILPTDQWLEMKLTARGSNVELYCQGVKVVETTRTLKRGQIAVLLQGGVESSIRNMVISEEAPTCFVVMQFTDEFDVLYRDVIRPVCESYGYKVIRGDDFHTSGQIMEDVTRSIRTAALIIADVTPDNANVFYEVGFAHAISKPTILLSDRKREHLPFDISGFRTLFYDNTIGGKGAVELRLKQHLDALRPK